MKKVFYFLSIVIFLETLFLNAQYCDSLVLLGNCYEGSYNLVVHNDTLMFLATTNSIISYNIKNPDEPERLVKKYFDDEIDQIYLYNNFLFISGDEMKIKIFDISNPSNMVFVSSISMKMGDMQIRDGFAYIGNEGTMTVYDLTEIANPKYIKAINIFTNFRNIRIDISGNKLFASANYYEYMEYEEYYAGQAAVYNINDPANPLLLYSSSVDYPYDVSADSGYIYLATRNGIKIYRDNNTNMIYSASINNTARRLKCINNILIAGGSSGITIYNVTDKNNIYINQSKSGFVSGEISCEQNLILSAGGNNFRTYSFYADTMSLRYSLTTENIIGKTFAYDSRLYSAQYQSRIIITNIDNNLVPSRIGSIEAGTYKRINDFYVLGKYLYLALLHSYEDYMWYELAGYVLIYDISVNPPVFKKSYEEIDKVFNNIKVCGNTVYAMKSISGHTDFYTCPKENFTNQTELDKFSVEYEITDISSDEDMLFMSTKTGGILCRNLTSNEDVFSSLFSNKYIVGMSAEMPYIAALTSDGWLYSLYYDGIETSLFKVDSMPLEADDRSIELKNDYIYLCGGSKGFFLLTHNEGILTLLDTFNTNYNTYSSSIDKERLYITDPGTGIWVFKENYELTQFTHQAEENDEICCDVEMLSNNQIRLRLNNFDKGVYNFAVTDLCGRIRLKKEIKIETSLYEEVMQISKLTSGTYYILIQNKDISISKRITKF